MALANEEQVVRRCQQGELDAFEMLYRHYEVPMLSIAHRLLGNREDAEDALQKAFLKLYRKIGQFTFRSSFSSWLYRIVVNTCYNRLKADKRAAFVPLEKLPEIPYHPRTEIGLRLQEAIDGLPPRMKACFVLFAVQGFKQREIANILDTKEGTVKAQVFAAKTRLREILGEQVRGLDTDELR